MNTPQLMWIDVITAVLSQPTFDVKIGNMGYVFKNMIAKYVSSSDYYRVSCGAFNELIKPNPELHRLIKANEPLDMKKYFYGKDKPSFMCEFISWEYTTEKTYTYSNGLVVNVSNGDIAIKLGKILSSMR
jgi:hypothetical protein